VVKKLVFTARQLC